MLLIDESDSESIAMRTVRALATFILSAALVLSCCLFPGSMPCALAEGEQDTQEQASNDDSSSDQSADASSNASGADATSDTTDEEAAAQAEEEQRLADALARIQAALDVEGTADTIAVKLATLADELEMQYEDLGEIQTRLLELSDEQTTLQAQLDETNAELEEAKQLRDEAVLMLYKNDSLGFISVLLGAESFDDFIDRSCYIEKIVDDCNDAIQEVADLKAQQTAQLKELQVVLDEQEELQEKAQSEGEQLATKLAEYTTELGQIDASVLTLINELDDYDSETVSALIEQLRVSTDSHSAIRLNAGSATSKWYGYAGGIESTEGSHPEIVEIAMQYLGVPYVWGGQTPSGFDCSGLVKYCYAQIGIDLTHYARTQFSEGVQISVNSLMPGDLVFFGSDVESIHHVGIYIGDGKYIHAPRTGDVVKISNLSDRSDFIGACRP